MIYKIEQWHKKDAHGTVIQQVYCLSDMHGAELIRLQDAVFINTTEQEHRKIITR